MKVKYILTLATLLLSLSAFAQRGKFFTTDHQLSSSFVTQVYLDNEGFIWTTTRNGINRYDGYQFRVFKKENEHDSSLASNYVNSMMQDRKGLFYFGMYGALQTWDGNCFLERANGDVLVGTSGLGILKFKDQKTAYQEKGPLATIHTVNSMIEDRTGTLWIVTEHMGLISYNGKTVKRHMQNLPSVVFSCLCEGADGIIYAGSTNCGVFRMQGDTFVHIAETGTKAVSSLYRAHDGNIVIGYDGQGIALYNPRKPELIDNPFFSLEVNLPMSKVYSITEDKSGNLWFGLLQKGIFMQPISFKGFHYMGHKLGAFYHLPHGVTVSLVLDEVMRYNSAEAPEKMGTFPQYDHPNALRRYAEIAEYLGITGENDNEKLEKLIAKIDELKDMIGIKRTIKDYGISEEEFLKNLDEMSEMAFDDQCTGANPRYPLISEIKDLYLKVYYGGEK